MQSNPEKYAIEAAKDFLNRMRQDGLRVTCAYLFGSRVNGTSRPESDIDLAVVSPLFSGLRCDDLGKIARIKIKAHKDLEIHPFSESDFNENDFFTGEILKTGLKLA